MLTSYPSIYNLGHAAIGDLLKGPVIVEEKIDGSQFSFGKTEAGELYCRSKGANINMVAPEGMFKRGVETVQALADKLIPGFVYRGEYLNGPHHNALTYNRVPAHNVIVFDITSGDETYLSPMQKAIAATELGLECVPVLFRGVVEDIAHFRTLLDTESVLGGQKIEGVVIKPEKYDLFGRDKKVLLGKFVSESFREVHSRTWDAEHKTKGPSDVVQLMASKYGTTARWNKAVIHLKENGTLEQSPRDIGLLMKEVPVDVLKECIEDIKKDLFEWAWPQLRRTIVRGLPEWYKEELLKLAFVPDTAPHHETPIAQSTVVPTTPDSSSTNAGIDAPGVAVSV